MIDFLIPMGFTIATVTALAAAGPTPSGAGRAGTLLIAARWGYYRARWGKSMAGTAAITRR
jgi:hypothetical protein